MPPLLPSVLLNWSVSNLAGATGPGGSLSAVTSGTRRVDDGLVPHSLHEALGDFDRQPVEANRLAIQRRASTR